jgi:uncharacterized membrane protein (UPF0127 family)
LDISLPEARLEPASKPVINASIAALFFILSLALACVHPAPTKAETRPDFPTGTLTLITTSDGDSLRLPVEFAVTDKQRRFGLMHRQNLPRGQGMLFIFPEEDIQSFWMKNTLIALDMVFFDANGLFVRIHRNVPPLSLKSRGSGAPAQYVLEINAGEADTFGIGPSTRLQLPAFP